MDFEKLSGFASWIGNVLQEIVTGIRNTFIYWKHRADELEQYAE